MLGQLNHLEMLKNLWMLEFVTTLTFPSISATEKAPTVCGKSNPKRAFAASMMAMALSMIAGTGPNMKGFVYISSLGPTCRLGRDADCPLSKKPSRFSSTCKHGTASKSSYRQRECIDLKGQMPAKPCSARWMRTVPLLRRMSFRLGIALGDFEQDESGR